MIGDIETARAELERDKAALRQREVELASAEIERMEAEHVASIRQCRAMQDRLSALNDDIVAAQSRWMQAGNAARAADSRLADHHGNRRQKYELPEETAAWESQLAELKANCTKAEHAHGAAWLSLDKVQNERRRLASEFEDGPKAEELNLRLKVHSARERLAKMRPAAISGEPRSELWGREPVSF